ncbi:MAG: type II toxin-antitoxin system YafQ family toxin [Campylobacterales bacterium]|nr:type II toxin-antitoxin system YafQ family toxin [Campylobacterales bacterium]
MLKLFRTKTFLKEYKKLNISDQHYAKYVEYITILLKEERLPAEALNHNLQGNYKNYSEFHISGDLLIIYLIEDGYLKLVRIGTHAQLFE